MSKQTSDPTVLMLSLLVLLAGCSGSAVPMASGDSRQSSDAPAPTQKPLIYLSDSDNSNVYVFDKGGVQVGMLSNLRHPQGLFVDDRHRLWVANYSNSDVLVFPRGHTNPTATYNDPKQNPMDVTICPNGLVFVSNVNGSISVYKQGKANPIRLLSDSKISNDIDLACDANNNVFTAVEITSSGPGAVDEYAGGVQRGLKRLPISVGFAYGIAVTVKNTLLVGDDTAHSVSEYTEDGHSTKKSVSMGSDDWYGLALGWSDALLAADYSKSLGQAVEFPKGTPLGQYLPQFVGSGSSPDQIVGVAYDRGE